MFKGICFALAIFFVMISMVYNKAYNDTMADYEPYDFSEFQAQTQTFFDTPIQKPIKHTCLPLPHPAYSSLTCIK